MPIHWRITYLQRDKKIDYGCFNKKEMVYEYLKVLSLPFTDNISDLKIWKGDNEYTYILNKFLSK